MFFIFLLSSVISLIWSSLLPQWTSQRRLKSSMFSTYDNGFSNFNWKLHKIYKKNFFTLYFFTILSCLLIRLRRLIIIKEELIFLKYQFFCLDFFCYSWNWRQLPFVKKCKKTHTNAFFKQAHEAKKIHLDPFWNFFCVFSFTTTTGTINRSLSRTHKTAIHWGPRWYTGWYRGGISWGA